MKSESLNRYFFLNYHEIGILEKYSITGIDKIQHYYITVLN
jgi:hypothetical protein